MKLKVLITLALALTALLACSVSADDGGDNNCEKSQLKSPQNQDVVTTPQVDSSPSPPPHHHKHHHKHRHPRKHRKHRKYRKNKNKDVGATNSTNDGNNGGNGSNNGDSSVTVTPVTPPSPQSKKQNKNKNTSLSPNGRKAGISGQEAAGLMSSSISWVNNWGAKPYADVPKGVDFVTQCYGFGWSGHDDDWKRFEDFKKVKPGKTDFVIGPNEIDFKGSASAGYIPPKEAAKLWDQYFGPWKDAGSTLVSPSCAKRDETWMAPFLDAVSVKPDVINVHVFDSDPTIVPKVLDHYRQFGKPMWITEFACINFKTGHECSQQETIDFIYAVVDTFENDDMVMAYSYADAENGPHCKLSNGNKLTASGHAYLNAVSKYSNKKRKRGMDLKRKSNDFFAADLSL